MEIAFHCPNCLADLIYDESKSYTCCFCHTVFTGKNEVKELEGGYYVGDAWNDKVYHTYHCEDCGSDFVAKPATAQSGCPLCSSASVKDNGGMIGAMPRRAIPFAHTRQQAQEMFLDYIRNNSAVGRTLATDENKDLLHKVYVPIFLFNYEVVAHARVTAMLRNKAAEGKTLFGINGTEGIAEQLSVLRSSFSRFQANRKGAQKDASNQPSEHVTGGVLSWQGIPFDASGILPNNVINMVQPYDQSKMVLVNEKILMDTPILAITKDPVSCMQEFMERIKKWTRQMIMDAHSDSYDISYFQDKTDYPLGIGELVLFPIWYMKGEYMGRDFYFAMNGQNGEVDANIPMSKGTSKNAGITYQQYWDKTRCTALNDTHFEFNIHDPNIEILDYSFFEKPKESRVTPDGRKRPEPRDDMSLGSIYSPSEKKTDSGKKPFSSLDVEVGAPLKKRDPNKKMTKEEEIEHEREMTERLRKAAQDKPKGDMAAASSVPSWAKAVTPPPSVSAPGNRPTRTKKPGTSKMSAAAASSKPLWEKTEEELEMEQKPQKPMSMADRMARGDSDELEFASPFDTKMPPIGASSRRRVETPAEEPEADADGDLSGILAEAQAQADAFAQETTQRGETDRPKPDMEQAFREQISAGPRAEVQAEDAYEVPMPKVSRPARRAPEPQNTVEEPVADTADEGEAEAEEMVANITFSFNKKKPPFSEEEKPVTSSAIPRQPEKAPEEAQGMAIMNSEYDSGVLRHSDGDHEIKEEDDGVREIFFKPQPRTSANFKGSDENDRPLAFRPAPPLAFQRDGSEPEIVDPNDNPDKMNRPLAQRPPAPLAQKRGDVYVEEVEPHPELDENNRPLAQRPPAPLARAEEQGPSLEYMTEQPLDDEIHQMPSLERQSRWGEMPEAKETPSWAKPQEPAATAKAAPAWARPAGRTDTRAEARQEQETSANPRNKGRSHMSRDELRAAEEEAVRRASNAAHTAPRARTLDEKRRATEVSDAAEAPSPSPFRPAPQPRTLEEKRRLAAEERAAEQESSEAPAHSSAFRPSPRPPVRPSAAQPAQRPQVSSSGSARPSPRPPVASDATRPAPRPPQRPGMGARPGTSRPGTGSAGNDNGGAKQVPIWERVPETDGPVPAWGSSAAYTEDRPRGSLMKPKDQIIDVEKPRERPTLWRPDGEVKEILPSGLHHADEEDEKPKARELGSGAREINVPSRPAAPSADRPRTFAQRRQMEEEERRRQIQSSFSAQPQEDSGDDESTARSGLGRPGMRPGTVNKTFESTQFEDKPSVVASLDMLPEPLEEESIHHLAKDSSIPALAREHSRVDDELEEAEKAAEKAIRGLPDLDPEGPNPFKPN
ncbi:MAG: hypothetical protein IK020_04750 [Clostridiales bacterium]|nr:hypothetical protein [Clostridiales bacterium]